MRGLGDHVLDLVGHSKTEYLSLNKFFDDNVPLMRPVGQSLGVTLGGGGKCKLLCWRWRWGRRRRRGGRRRCRVRFEARQGAYRPHHRDLMISWRLRQYPLAWAHVTLRRQEVVVAIFATAAMGAVHRADGQGADGAHAGASLMTHPVRPSQ
jgi:hypothetical protein